MEWEGKMKHKILLEGILNIQKLNPLKQKEIAASLALPENSQKDLMFMSSILVSTGTNKNGANFQGSELVKARGSIVQKPLNIEHSETDIIGHITDWIYLTQEGEMLDDEEMFNKLTTIPSVGPGDDTNKPLDEDIDDLLDCQDEDELEDLVEAQRKFARELDKLDMDIGVVCAVYRDRFPEIAEQIELGKYKVSMECYYSNYDIMVNGIIIPRDMAMKATPDYFTANNIKSSLIHEIKSVAEGKSMGSYEVSRVLRDISFCGVGIVKNPANDRSLILEAAKKLDSLEAEASSRAVAAVEVDLKSLSEQNSAMKSEDISEISDIPENQLNPEEALKDAIENQEQVIKEVLEVGEFCNTVFVVQDSSTKEVVSIKSSLEEAKQEAIQRTFLSKGTKSYKVLEELSYFAPMELFSEEEAERVVKHSVNDIGRLENSTEIFSCTKMVRVLDREQTPEEVCENSVVDVETNDSEEKKDTAKEKVEKIVKQGTTKKLNPLKPLEKVSRIEVPKNPKPLSREERKSLKREEFALREARSYPIHTKDRVIANMQMFESISKKLGSFKEKKEFFNNLVIARLKLGVDTRHFEKSCTGYRFKAGRDYSEHYGVPRLQKFPLNTKEQVISAMSRYPRIKMEISDQEREFLVVNILRAAVKFGINTNSFRKRVLDS